MTAAGRDAAFARPGRHVRHGKTGAGHNPGQVWNTDVHACQP